jgi:hypothetical protein
MGKDIQKFFFCEKASSSVSDALRPRCKLQPPLFFSVTTVGDGGQRQAKVAACEAFLGLVGVEKLIRRPDPMQVQEGPKTSFKNHFSQQVSASLWCAHLSADSLLPQYIHPQVV